MDGNSWSQEESISIDKYYSVSDLIDRRRDLALDVPLKSTLSYLRQQQPASIMPRWKPSWICHDEAHLFVDADRALD